MLFSLCMVPFDYIWWLVEENGVATLIYSVIVFLCFGWVFEMVVVSGYRRIMLWESTKKEENKESPIKTQEVL